MDLTGRTALITGAGSGIGRATALAFARRGARRIWLVGRELEGLQATGDRLKALGCEGLVRAVDVSDLDRLEAVFAEADRAGGLDIVFNNAGVVTGAVAFPATAPERIKALIDVNVTAVIFGTQWAVQQMARRGGGVVINTSSIAALNIAKHDLVYTATKAAVLSFSKSCVHLQASHGVRVNAVLPGLVETPILWASGDGEPAPWVADALASGRAMPPERVADAVVAIVEDDGVCGEAVEILGAEVIA